MKFIQEYILYLKDNPQGYWFKAKRYGWGWVPARWQGWCVILAYVALLATLIVFKEKDVPGNDMSGSNVLTFAVPVVLLTIVLVAIAYKKGEKPRWQWGAQKK